MLNRFSELRNKEIIHVCEGCRLGYMNDLTIELETGRVVNLIVPGPCRFLGLFGRQDDYVIPWCCVRRIGEDIILVDGPVTEWKTPRKREVFFSEKQGFLRKKYLHCETLSAIIFSACEEQASTHTPGIPWPVPQSGGQEMIGVEEKQTKEIKQMAVVSMKQLLEAGVHFGHQTRRWNRKMETSPPTQGQGIHLIIFRRP